MKYEKCCRNCEHAFLETCKSCDTFGNNTYQNFELRKELALIQSGDIIQLPCTARYLSNYTVEVYVAQDGEIWVTNPKRIGEIK